VSAALRRLAGAYGIVDEYDDIWGRRHATSDATRRALLAAMGVAADRDDDIEVALASYEREAWTSALAPLTVVRQGRSATLALRLPATLSERGLELEVATEDGDRIHVAPTRLDRTRSHGAGERMQVEVQLAFDHALAPGYHAIEVRAGGQVVAQGALAVAPPTCHRPQSVRDGGRTWGLALQLYGLRSRRSWGIGDFSDLAAVARAGGPGGFGLVGVNPLHALFTHNPRHCSPYSPSSRLFLNVLYLDVTAVMDFDECREARELVAAADFARRLEAVRCAELVDYAEVAALKLAVLRRLHRHFVDRHCGAGSERSRQFDAFVEAGGVALQRHAAFEALQEHFHSADRDVWGWPAWPAEYRDPASAAVARFVEAQREAVEFHLYLQWQAQLQLSACAEFARAARLSIGLYTDLAVSVDRAGAEAWANQDLYALGASIGAPPDDFNLHGQDWGLPPLIPARLRRAGYAPFIATLRANMQAAGALRIDHVMGLMRLFWVPPGGTAADGAYVRYPFDDLLGLVALESHRHGCLVVGEDLGTVSDDVRMALAAHDVLSYRVLPFERNADGALKPPAAYPEAALVTAGTHDLPTLAGWWEAHDVEVRHRCGLASDAARMQQLAGRAEDRRRLAGALAAMAAAGAADAEAAPASAVPALAVQAFLARTPAALLAVQPEDVLGVREQANLPGTTDAHPNWQRRLPVPLEDWITDARFVELAARLNAERRDRRAARARIPRATYRLQLHGGFTFRDATAIVPYLAALGVSHVYCSPYLRARPGSRHGYDIVDHGELNPEIGSRADFERFVAVLRQHGMGHVADIVPNHMGVMGADNAWWMDVLEHGPASMYADFFDIDWTPIDPDLAGRVLLPVLGAAYGEVLDSGELRVAFEPDRGGFAVHYHEHRFPLDPRSYPAVLAPALADPSLPAAAAARLAGLVGRLADVPARTERAAVDARRVACERLRQQLAAAAAEPAIARAVGRALAAFDPAAPDGAAAAADRLHALLELQAFRLAYWRVAFDEINYRRFFDVNDLAALRMEHPAAFEATHRFILDRAAEGMIDGLRVDHPDGLADPEAYFARVQAAFARRAGIEAGDGARPIYLVAEKIIASHEDLPTAWPVHGTTGYRFANAANGVLVDTEARERIDRTWRGFVGDEATDFETVAYQARRAMIRGPLAAGLTVLANRALRLARRDRRTRDHTLSTLRQGLEEIAASFPVYRTYVSAAGASEQDRRYIDWAVARARRRSRTTDVSVFEFLRALLLAEPRAAGVPAEERVEFALRFQQFCAPVAAKGIEDTAFYRFNRLLALADVGGDPSQFGMTVRAFHGASRHRAAEWSSTMLATSTHDNKRAEDVRARLDVLSEVPAAWRLMLRHWARFNRSRKREVDGAPAPSRNDEVLLYQTLLGSWPIADAGRDAYRKRIAGYMQKATREAKVHTSWIAVNDDYEQAVASFVEVLLADGPNLFLDDLTARLPFFAWYGLLNSVSLALLKMTSPGVPDLYQGTELVDLSLVDPDNRRPVDYDARRARLAELETLEREPPDLRTARLQALFAAADGGAKLWVIRRLLAERRHAPGLFERGRYVALATRGLRARHVVAYARVDGADALVVVAGRLFTGLGRAVGELPLGDAAWGDTAVRLGPLAGRLALADVLTGTTLAAKDELRLADAFARFPGAALRVRVKANGG
jgi:(1->4)-alpha-D-glucan 1-alpha-D-glucosylmutase